MYIYIYIYIYIIYIYTLATKQDKNFKTLLVCQRFGASPFWLSANPCVSGENGHKTIVVVRYNVIFKKYCRHLEFHTVNAIIRQLIFEQVYTMLQ